MPDSGVAGPMRGVLRCARLSPGQGRPERDVLVPADGHLADGGRFGAGTSALVMLSSVAVYEMAGPGQPGAGQIRLADAGRRALVLWACQQQLGQDAALVGAVARRRELALRALDRVPGRLVPGRRPRCHLRLIAKPEWRLAVGLGNVVGAYEIGLALHGTYGWPVIPGSSLKGLAAAWAGSPAAGAEPEDVQRVFGTTTRAGTVRFLDAIPADGPAVVEADVLTPHVKPYYDSVAADGRAFGGAERALVPPAEYHNPVPVTFLTVRGSYAVDLYGPDRDDLRLAARWLRRAGDELGAGAKTAAGYGYLTVTEPAGTEDS